MIAIIDYGMGNLRSVLRALEHVGAEARVIHDPALLTGADKVVLPGVGAFRDAIAQLHRQGFVEPLQAFIASGRPFLGVCLGLQLLFDVSEEDGVHRGLGVVPGRVMRFDMDAAQASGRKVPHMGWNALTWDRPCPLLAGLESGTHFYFVHSYYVVPADPDVVCGWCDYGGPFAAMIWKENVVATQFHPEKSQQAGLRILHNFAVAGER